MIGTEVASALLKFSELLIACSMLASPDSAMRRSGWLRLHAGDRVLDGGRRLVDVGDVPGTSNVTRALRPSFDTSAAAGRQRGADAGRVPRPSRQRRRHLGRRLPHGRIGGEGDAGGLGLDQHVLGVSVVLRGRDLVQDPLRLPGLAGVVCGRFREPSAWPAMKTAATSSSQPKTAVLRCRALQPATRSVTLGARAGCFVSMALRLGDGTRAEPWCGRPEAGWGYPHPVPGGPADGNPRAHAIASEPCSSSAIWCRRAPGSP